MQLSTASMLGVFFFLGAAALSFSSGEPPTNQTPKLFTVARAAMPLPLEEILAEPPTLLLPASAPIEEAPAPSVPLTISPEPKITPQDIEVLMAMKPQMPIDDLDPLGLDESFREDRSNGRKHRAIDMTAPRGKPLRAVVDGIIAYKFYNDVGGKSLYLRSTDGSFMFFYAHLSRYEKGLTPGQVVKKGDIIGYVGDTGNAKGHPHLHFAIAKLTEPDMAWSHAIVNPYYIFTQKPYPFRKGKTTK